MDARTLYLLAKGKLKELRGNEEGINTVEIVVILAIVVGLALIFRDQMLKFVTDLLRGVTGEGASAGTDEIRNAGAGILK